MLDAEALLSLQCGAVVAPAGHGKTELITSIAARGRRTLILTHTHAGVHAIQARLRKIGVPGTATAVDTIAGWAMRYARAFPKIALPPPDMPKSGAEWDQLYIGATKALSLSAVREVVLASYDLVLIDEYQDCGALQHHMVKVLSGVLPTFVFGDPMQGIFEFAGATLSWDCDIHPHFQLAGTLNTPYRWQGKNPELGVWISQTREKLLRGEPIDLRDGPIEYRQTTTAFDMEVFFEGVGERQGSFAAIHCRKGVCYRLASAASGAFQAIEELGANRLRQFAQEWDQTVIGHARAEALKSLLDDCFRDRSASEEKATPEDAYLVREMNAIAAEMADGGPILSASRLMALARKHTKWKLFRGELWADAERAMREFVAGRALTMNESVAIIRHRSTLMGRRLPRKTISTPLLLKGLEFDHVVIPDARHFATESHAQAKLFYVAISRASHSLTITGKDPVIQFPPPRI